MNASVPNLFKGIAVVIDNGIGTEEAIGKILANIRAVGGHAIELLSLPKADYDLEHFSRVSFFIMDWNLSNSTEGIPLEAGVRLPEGLDREMIAENIAFLKRLSQSRHAPVFIFTNEDPGRVMDELSADPDLHRSVEESHILVMRKVEVTDKLYDVLEEWANRTPSVLTLKTWERGFLRAANELFIDLHNRTPFWPVLLWQTFGADEVPPEVEMNKLINRLVESRMDLLNLDLTPFVETVEEQRKKEQAAYQESMYRVLEGERFLRNERLKEDIYAPGDVFEFPVQDNRKSYWINIRAECDCLRGDEDLPLYLLQAKVVDGVEERINKEFGNFNDEKDNETIVFAMIGGKTFSIKYKDMKIKTIKQIRKESGERVGRLLPPFITRVQQRYAAYIQRPGMPRIPAALHETA
ncbi:hypothetical protein HFO99_24415 [Rhizobium leguminosarum]|uniref:hypothetical protein n=1 Tax=Rhizobium leguminosarum TaxID=384 RepID=UPI001C964D29|nr:hypothetical protein [Rhizobium leguminosarum]MBY5337018.1 hypothetical protein [Rhizobium leguminosarum]